MHTSRSPSSAPPSSGVAPPLSGVSPGEALGLSVSGSKLTVSRRPNSASPGKTFCRSVSVIGESRHKHRNALSDVLGGSRSIKNLRRSNSTTQVNHINIGPHSPEPHDEYLTLFSSSDTSKKLSKDTTTWNILDDQPRASVQHSPRSSSSLDSQSGHKRREAAVSLAATFTANNRSNKGAVGNSVTTILHNNHNSDKLLTPKSSNQRPAFNNLLKANDEVSADAASVTKSQKNFTSCNSTPLQLSAAPHRRREVTEEEAERFIQQVNHAALIIQRWFRLQHDRRRSQYRDQNQGQIQTQDQNQSQEQTQGQSELQQLLSSKRKEWEQRALEERRLEQHKDEDRRRIREEKARLARLQAVQELQQRRAQRSLEPQFNSVETEATGTSGLSSMRGKRGPKTGLESRVQTELQIEIQTETEIHTGDQTGIQAAARPVSPGDKNNITTGDPQLNIDFSDLTFRAVSPALSNHREPTCPQGQVVRSVSTVEPTRFQSKTTLNELLDSLRLLEEEPCKLQPSKDSLQDGDSTSLTADNLQRHVLQSFPAPEGGALLSEAKLQSIMSFLDEMEKSEQERPRSATSGSHREVVLSEDELAGVEQASATAAELSGNMMKIRMEVEEKKRTVNLLQAALAQQRELTVHHIKETEKELNRNFQLQKEQYEATIQRHLAFIDQLISDKKALSERCEGVVSELKLVDHKYTKKIQQMQEQHDMVWQVLGPLCEVTLPFLPLNQETILALFLLLLTLQTSSESGLFL